MSVKPSNTASAQAHGGATIINYSEAKVAWAWRRIEHLVTLYVNGDPETGRLSTGPKPEPLGETVSLASAMQAGIPLEPIRELWAKAKAHMAEQAEAEATEGGAA